MIGIPTDGTAISRRIVVSIGNEVVKSNNPTLLKENGGSLQLKEDWARGVLKKMILLKRKGATGKLEPTQPFLLEEILTCQKKISGAIFHDGTHKELIVNLNQTSLSYVNSIKYNFDANGVIIVKSIDSKRQIIVTFAVSMSG